MNIADFRSFIKDYCYDEFAAYHDREGFVKTFIRTNEQDFYNLRLFYLINKIVYFENYEAELIFRDIFGLT